jgi:hypothetical protein
MWRGPKQLTAPGWEKVISIREKKGDNVKSTSRRKATRQGLTIRD